MKTKKILTLEDLAHFIIFRELDKMGIDFPYFHATRMCKELQSAVSYRSPIIKRKKK